MAVRRTRSETLLARAAARRHSHDAAKDAEDGEDELAVEDFVVDGGGGSEWAFGMRAVEGSGGRTGGGGNRIFGTPARAQDWRGALGRLKNCEEPQRVSASILTAL